MQNQYLPVNIKFYRSIEPETLKVKFKKWKSGGFKQTQVYTYTKAARKLGGFEFEKDWYKRID